MNGSPNSAPGETTYFDNPEQRFSDERLTEMIDNLVAREVLSGDKPFAMGIIEGTDPDSDVARAVEYTKFDKVFSNGYDLMESEYQPYDATSTFLLVADMHQRKPAGVFRLIHNGPNGFKSVNDIANPGGPWGADMTGAIDAHNRQGKAPVDTSRVLDVATLARAEEYDVKPINNLISSALYRYTKIYAQANGYNELVTIFDEKPLEKFQRVYDNPWETIEGLGPASYLDSPLSVPLYLNIGEYEERISAGNPEIKQFFDTGEPAAQYLHFPEQA